MDSEGWIDIPMISSFNRIRNLTTDVALVKEVMQLSTLLEVREDKVRLAFGESKRWVLPEAAQSTVPPDPLADPLMLSPPTDSVAGDMVLSMSGLGFDEVPGPGNMNGIANGSIAGSLPKHSYVDVENALMKNVPPSSNTSMQNGDESVEKGGTVTPATSTSEDKEEASGPEQDVVAQS